jgi:hypothetical protein
VATAERLQSSDAAGKELGIPGRTIRRWREDPRLADIVRKTREETAEDVSAAMALAWQRIIERLANDAVETRDLIILAGVATDKTQLLTGKATDRVEQVSITDGFDDEERDALNDAIRRELERRTHGHAPEAAVGPAEPAGAETAER